MRKIIKLLFLFFLAVFIIIQFFQPEKNLGGITSDHIFEQENLPPEIKTILSNSCLDCHSNQTNYLWYHKIAPVSWFINSHIEDGKKELNFSNWGQMDVFDQIGTLDKIRSEIEDKEMPLESYTLIHKKARLSDEQISIIATWIDQFSEELLLRSFNTD